MPSLPKPETLMKPEERTLQRSLIQSRRTRSSQDLDLSAAGAVFTSRAACQSAGAGFALGALGIGGTVDCGSPKSKGSMGPPSIFGVGPAACVGQRTRATP